MCGVFTSSQALLEAHFQGRRHLKAALVQVASDAAQLGVQPAVPTDPSVPR